MTSSRPLRPPSLPVVAVACVLLAGVLLVLSRPSARRSVVPPAVAGLEVVGAGASFVVGPRWSRTSGDAVLFYAGPDGRPRVGLVGAVVADAGYCAGLPTSTRGFAGFVAVPGLRSPASTTRDLAARWARGVSGRSPPEVRVREVSLADGTAAVRATLRLPARPGGGVCLASHVVLDVVCFDTAGGTAGFVLVRDVDPDGVGEREAEAVVQSLRRRT